MRSMVITIKYKLVHLSFAVIHRKASQCDKRPHNDQFTKTEHIVRFFIGASQEQQNMVQ